MSTIPLVDSPEAHQRRDSCVIRGLEALSRTPRGVALVLLFLTAFFPGCVAFESKPIEVSQSLAALDGRTLDDPGLGQFIAARGAKARVRPGCWGLNELTLAALYFHPDLAAARAEQAVAAANLKQAKERPNPVVSFGPGYNSSSAGISPWILATALDFPIEWPAKRTRRRKGAEKVAEAAQWRLAEAGWTARRRLRESMLTLYGARQMRRFLTEQEALQGEIAVLLDKKRKAGESSPFEASQARLGLSQTRLSLHEAERQAAVAQVRLAEAVGISGSALAAKTLDFSAFEEAGPKVAQGKARRQALTNRADILAALAEYAAAEESLRLEIANQYPDVNLGPGYELDQSDNKWSLGLSLELPLMNQNQGKIARAEAARELAAAQFQQVQSTALAQIDEAVVNLRGSRAKAQSAREILNEVRHEARMAEEMKTAGAIERSELLRRNLELSAARLALVDAEIGEQEAVGQLEDALQIPTTLNLNSL